MLIPGYVGDFPVGAVVDFKFTVTGSTSDLSQNVFVPADLASSPALSVYRDNETTENTTGLTLTVGFDSRTGLHHARITTASDASFYARGHDYYVVVTAGTNGSTRVGCVVASFSIEHRTQRYAVA